MLERYEPGAFCYDAALGLLVPTLSAAATYTYNGPDFNTFVNNPPYGTSDHLSIMLDLSTPLQPNLSNADVSTDVFSWAVAVGSTSYGSASGDTISALTFTTGTSGQITDWYSYLVGAGTFGFISSGDTGDSAFDFVAQGDSWNASTSSIGAWIEQPSTATPEPSAGYLLMLGLGSALISFRVQCRARKAGTRAA